MPSLLDILMDSTDDGGVFDEEQIEAIMAKHPDQDDPKPWAIRVSDKEGLLEKVPEQVRVRAEFFITESRHDIDITAVIAALALAESIARESLELADDEPLMVSVSYNAGQIPGRDEPMVGIELTNPSGQKFFSPWVMPVEGFEDTFFLLRATRYTLPDEDREQDRTLYLSNQVGEA